MKKFLLFVFVVNLPLAGDTQETATRPSRGPIVERNVDALKQAGVTDLVSVSACGSLREDFAPGMFVLVDVSSTGRSGLELANELVDHAGVAVMPGSSFGRSLDRWIRVALTQPDDEFDEGCRRIIEYVNRTPTEEPQ